MVPGRRELLVGAAVAVAVLVLGGGTWLVVSAVGGDPDSVQEVADAAQEAAEELDVDAGVRLLCEPPTAEERSELADLISEGQERAGTDDPDVDYSVGDVQGDREGSFRVVVSSTEEGLSDRSFGIEVRVATDGDRSCIDDATGFDPTATEQ